MKELAAEVSVFERQVLSRVDKGKQAARPLNTDDRKEIQRQIKDASMDSEAHTRLLQKKLPPIEQNEKQSHRYLDRIRVRWNSLDMLSSSML